VFDDDMTNYSNPHQEPLGNVCTNCGDNDQFGGAQFHTADDGQIASGSWIYTADDDLCVRCTPTT
jgi:hypothetical protein